MVGLYSMSGCCLKYPNLPFHAIIHMTIFLLLAFICGYCYNHIRIRYELPEDPVWVSDEFPNPSFIVRDLTWHSSLGIMCQLRAT